MQSTSYQPVVVVVAAAAVAVEEKKSSDHLVPIPIPSFTSIVYSRVFNKVMNPRAAAAATSTNNNNSQQMITPEEALKHALSQGGGSSSTTSQHHRHNAASSGAIESMYNNKRPRPSNQSPRTEDLVRRKNESEQKFRNLMGSIQMVDDTSSGGDGKAIKSMDTKSSGGSVNSKQRKSKKTHKSKHSTTSASASGSRISGSSRRRQRDPTNSSRSARHESRRAAARQDTSNRKKNTSQTDGGNWAIKSVVSDNMDSWEVFAQSESEFSESNAESSSFAADDSNDLLMQTPSSLLGTASVRPGLTSKGNSAAASPASSTASNLSATDLSKPHPSLRHLVVMDNNNSSGAKSSSSQRRRRHKRSSSSRSEKSQEKKAPPKKRDSQLSAHSTNPTPSVIAAGVQQLAAKLEVDVTAAPPKDTGAAVSKDSGPEFLNDDDSSEIRRKAARSANRRSRTQNRSRRAFGPEGIELHLDDDETMSTISHDPVLDYMAAARASDDAVVPNVLSEQEKQSLLAEVVKIARETQMTERERMKSSRSLADVLEASQEGDTTDNDDPSRATTAGGSILSHSRSGGSFLASTDVSKVLLTPEDRSASLEIDDIDLERNIVIGTPVEHYESGSKCKDGCCKVVRNPTYLAAIAILVIIAIVIISVLATVLPRSNDPSASLEPPTLAPTYTNSDIFSLIVAASATAPEALQDSNTPQSRSLAWIEGTTENSIRSNTDRILQRYALGTIFFATRGDQWRNQDRWMTFEDECTWFSSVNTPCDADGKYVRLDLRSNKLHGELPAEISMLTGLTSVDLPGNGLFGTIPFSLRFLESLTSLNLDANDYTRKLPTSVTRLTNLKMLSMNLNRFTGELPTEIGLLSNLEILSLAANRLSAGLPAEISNMRMLRELNLEFNEFSGSIRTELGLLRNLEYIKLDVNLFSRSIPSELGLLVNLQSFTCNDCSLFGLIPTEFGFLGKLETIELQANQLTGTLPNNLGSATSLRRVDLSRNSIGGTLPTSLGRLRDIKSFDMSLNKLSGTIPSELSNIRSDSFAFYLNSNQLTGDVPPGVCALLIDTGSVLSVDVGQVKACDCGECHTPLADRRYRIPGDVAG